TRPLPQYYPFSEGSALYENSAGLFVGITMSSTKFFTNSIMVTDAIWVEINSDVNIDLVLVGEWTNPIILIQGENKNFEKIENSTLGLDQLSGWWFSVAKSDIDNDGHDDLIVGNLGENYNYQSSQDRPFKIFSKDFNQSGNMDIVVSYLQKGTYYPVRGKECSAQQLPELKSKFSNYNSFAETKGISIYDNLGLSVATELRVSTLSSYVLMNKSDGFKKFELPRDTQLSSINYILLEDFDRDVNNELLLAGNLFTSEVETTRNEPSYGCLVGFTGKMKGKL
ncbi:MAG: VCBS repeat-containing protein, partial [Maribacter sp.]